MSISVDMWMSWASINKHNLDKVILETTCFAGDYLWSFNGVLIREPDSQSVDFSFVDTGDSECGGWTFHIHHPLVKRFT